MEEQKLVSVIIPTFGRGEKLKRAIMSVFSQQYPAIELIVVDDNGLGTDNQVFNSKVLKEWDRELIYIPHEKNKGGSAARNTGIRAAKGKYFALLDDDDEWLPKKLEMQVNCLQSLDNSWGGVFCGFLLKENDNIWEMKTHLQGNLAKELLQGKVDLCTSSTVLFRQEVFKTVGFFDETFRRQQDIEFMLRFFRNYKLAYVDSILGIIHGHNDPSAEVLELAKLQLLETFKSDIEGFGEVEAGKTYAIQYLELTRSFIKEKKFNEARQYFKKALSYRIPPCRKISLLLVDVIDVLANCEIKIMLKRWWVFFEKLKRSTHTAKGSIQ